MDAGPYGVSVSGGGFDVLLEAFAIAYCGWMPAEADELPRRAAHVGPQLLLQGIALDDAIAAKEAAETFGYTARVLEAAAPRDGDAPNREPIPERVRHKVWRRDQAKCVDCGSRERLQFDHIVPVSAGGSNTARNIELRCERCNLRKGATI
jgi:hypothetical protein